MEWAEPVVIGTKPVVMWTKPASSLCSQRDLNFCLFILEISENAKIFDLLLLLSDSMLAVFIRKIAKILI